MRRARAGSPGAADRRSGPGGRRALCTGGTPRRSRATQWASRNACATPKRGTPEQPPSAVGPAGCARRAQAAQWARHGEGGTGLTPLFDENDTIAAAAPVSVARRLRVAFWVGVVASGVVLAAAYAAIGGVRRLRAK